MKTESKNKVYSLCVSKRGECTSATIRVPYSYVVDLNLKGGSKLKLTRIENGFKAEKVMENDD